MARQVTNPEEKLKTFFTVLSIVVGGFFSEAKFYEKISFAFGILLFLVDISFSLFVLKDRTSY